MSNIKKIAVGFTFACLFALNAHAAVSGFVDAQFTTGDNITGNGTNNNPTFRVGDGAVWFTEKSGSTSVTVDIPFSTVTGGGSNAFNIAMGKAQAYVMHGYDFGLSWGLGQWDTVFGMEANDTVNNRFAQQGLLYGIKNITYAGLLLNYANGPISFDVLVANPHTQGLRNADNFDYAGKLKYTHSQFYISGGYTHHKDATTAESSMYADFTLGTKQGAFSADAEVALTKAAVAGAETGVGFGVWLGYDINTEWNAAGRFEYTSKVTNLLTNAGNYSQMAWAVGPQHKMGDKFTVRAEYLGQSVTAVQGGTSTSSHGGILSTVFKF